MDASGALARAVAAAFEEYVKRNANVSPEVAVLIARMEDRSKLADTVTSHLAAKVADKQAVLEMVSVAARLERCLALIASEVSGRGRSSVAEVNSGARTPLAR